MIFISGNSSLQAAAQTIQQGAYDFIEKPFSSEKLITTVKKCFDYYSLLDELNAFKTASIKYIGSSKKTKELKNIIVKSAATDSTVLITGESGTGKELVATMIHEKSNRNRMKMVKVNCSAIPDQLIESCLLYTSPSPRD